MPTTLVYEDTVLKAGTPVSTTNPLPVALGGSVSVAAGSLAKAEDAVHSTGDVGVQLLGVRAPVVPTVATSAAGDYSSLMLSPEGKQVTTFNAPSENTFAYTGAVLVGTDVAAKAAAAAGVRNYVTDVGISNSAATGFLFTIKDGATPLFQEWVAPGLAITHDFFTPLKGTAATAINFSITPATTTAYVNIGGFIGI